jgi:tRNA-specific 2-thiouridylase
MQMRVVVGLSGGVDSAVAAALLLEQGYEVLGVFMKNWHDTSVTISAECPWEEDSKDALLVAETLGIPFQAIDLSEAYKSRIVDYMFAEYQQGRTPNPDVLCNREIKFDIFLNTAMELGADFVATGHYCRKDEFIDQGEKKFRLLAGKDQNKDQSYFLCQLNQEQLSKSLFPIGSLTKPEVRKKAESLGLPNAAKKDSQGLCFIGKVRLPDFLQQQLSAKVGHVVEIDSKDQMFNENRNVKTVGLDALISSAEPFTFHPEEGKNLGMHQGAHFYTIGQRKGLGIGGKTEPLFVIGTDISTNTIYVGMGENHPGLFRNALRIEAEDVHWIRPDLKIKESESLKVLCRFRYRQNLEEAILHQLKDCLIISFSRPQKAITPGQFAAWYIKDELIGSGVISR